MLLRFRAENHRSLRDGAELSLMSSSARGAAPTHGRWEDITTRVAGIYGANASGKSTVLHALDFMVQAISYSATLWGDRDYFRFFPFALNKENESLPSTYEMDVVVDGVRYTYGFESSADGIHSEWLFSYPARRRRVLFERGPGENPSIDFGRHLPGENVTIGKLVGRNALFLSVAANNNHSTLKRIHHRITRHIRYARFTEQDKDARLRLVKRLIEDETLLRQAGALLRFADLGIESIELKISEIDSEEQANVQRFVEVLRSASPGVVEENIEEEFDMLRRKISFVHFSRDSDSRYRLPLQDQSSGTVAWLSIGVPALISLRHGDTFMIDEIDSSLHPRLTAALIRIFKDPLINESGAQLVFTSHDSALLGKMLGDDVVNSDEVWFTEKDNSGATDLYSLQEFEVRSSDNFERRYLQGRYGAIPVIEVEELRTALASAE